MEDRKEWKTGEKSDIEIRNLSVSFQDGVETVHAMEGVNAYFPAGSVTGLIGGERQRKITSRHVHFRTSLRSGEGGRNLHV